MELDPEAFTSDEPFIAALAWVDQVVQTDDTDSWYSLNDNLKRWFAQYWLSKNPAALQDSAARSRSRDEMVDVLVGPDGAKNGLFPYMWRVARRYILSVLGPFSGEELSVGTRTRAVTPDIEAVRLFRAADLPGHDGLHRFEPDAVHLSLVLLLSREHGQWRIASVGSWLPVLGWPPRMEELPASAID